MKLEIREVKNGLILDVHFKDANNVYQLQGSYAFQYKTQLNSFQYRTLSEEDSRLIAFNELVDELKEYLSMFSQDYNKLAMVNGIVSNEDVFDIYDAVEKSFNNFDKKESK